MKKDNNEEKVKKYRQKKLYHFLIMVCSAATIILATLSLMIKISVWYSIVSFMILLVFKRMYRQL